MYASIFHGPGILSELEVMASQATTLVYGFQCFKQVVQIERVELFSPKYVRYVSELLRFGSTSINDGHIITQEYLSDKGYLFGMYRQIMRLMVTCSSFINITVLALITLVMRVSTVTTEGFHFTISILTGILTFSIHSNT